MDIPVGNVCIFTFRLYLTHLLSETSSFMIFGIEKLEWGKFDGIYSQYDTVHECDRQTEGHSTYNALPDKNYAG